VLVVVLRSLAAVIIILSRQLLKCFFVLDKPFGDVDEGIGVQIVCVDIKGFYAIGSAEHEMPILIGEFVVRGFL